LSSDAQSSTQHLRAGQPCNMRPACFFSCWWSSHARGRHLHHEGLRPPKVLEWLQGRASFRRRLISWVHRVAHPPSDRSPLCSSENGAFFCNECDCRFSEEASLKRHSLQVHSDKPYKCDRCQANFFPDPPSSSCQPCPTCYGLVKDGVCPVPCRGGVELQPHSALPCPHVSPAGGAAQSEAAGGGGMAASTGL